MVEDIQTCGKGLADRSVLPAHLATLIAALAGILEEHQKSLVSNDANTAAERAAYWDLTKRYRNISQDLTAAARQMESYRGLAMAPHDVQVLRSTANASAFERFVEAERDLIDLLRTILTRDETMLKSMRPA